MEEDQSTFHGSPKRVRIDTAAAPKVTDRGSPAGASDPNGVHRDSIHGSHETTFLRTEIDF